MIETLISDITDENCVLSEIELYWCEILNLLGFRNDIVKTGWFNQSYFLLFLMELII